MLLFKPRNFLSYLFAAVALFGGEEVLDAEGKFPKGMEGFEQGQGRTEGTFAEGAGGAVPDNPAEDVADEPEQGSDANHEPPNGRLVVQK